MIITLQVKLSWDTLLCCSDHLPRGDVLMIVTTQLMISHHVFLISRHITERKEKNALTNRFHILLVLS